MGPRRGYHNMIVKVFVARASAQQSSSKAARRGQVNVVPGWH